VHANAANVIVVAGPLLVLLCFLLAPQDAKAEAPLPRDANGDCRAEEGDEAQTAPAISCAQWARLFVVWLCCTLAAGIIPGQALFAPMFANAGVFGSICEGKIPCGAQMVSLNMMLGLGFMLVMLSSLPVGLIFDIYGGRTVGTLGSVIVSFGLLLTSIPIFCAQWGLDAQSKWILPVAAMITDFGSILNSYCFISLIWHYPGSTTMILSLSTATYQISALLPEVLQLVMDTFGIGLGHAMLGFSALVMASVPVIYWVTPTQKDYYDRAKEALGVPLPKPKKSFELCSKLRNGWKAIYGDIHDHVCLCFGFTFGAIFAAVYNSMAFAYGRQLFGSNTAGIQLAAMQVQMTAVVGAICAPTMAKIFDFLGMQRFGWSLTLCLAPPLWLYLQPKGWAAWFTTIGLTLFTTLYTLFINRYLLYYAPPNRLGTYSGVFNLLLMFIVMPFSFGDYGWMLYAPSGERFFWPFLMPGLLGVILLVAFNVRFCIVHDGRGVPRYPRMLPEDEMELVAPFGAMTLDEAADIVGLDKNTLFRRLANPTAENMVELVAMIDLDKVTHLMEKRSAGELIAM
jgi:hypothetical protein